MDRLPAELVELIVHQCDFASLKQLRLVNKECRAMATPLVFEHFYMGYFTDHLKKLCHLAKSPLARYVKRFTFFSDLLPSWMQKVLGERIDYRPEYNSWVAAARRESGHICDLCFAHPTRGWTLCKSERDKLERAYELLPRHTLSDGAIGAAVVRYAGLRKQQASWREDRESLAFREYFAMLPNLTEATLTHTVPFKVSPKDWPVWKAKGNSNDWPVWKALRREIHVGPDDWRYWDRNDIPEDCEPEDYETEGYVPGHARGQAALCLLEAIGYRSSFFGTRHIERLEIQQSHEGTYEDLLGNTTARQADRSSTGLTVPEHKVRWQGIVAAFQFVTDLTMRVPFDPEHPFSSFFAGAEITKLLPAAKGLRRLDLYCIDAHDLEVPIGHSPYQRLTHLFGGLGPREGDNIDCQALAPPTWPHLEHLALSAIVGLGFLGFLRQHSATLRSLEMRHSNVNDAQKLIETIPKVLPNLEHVYLESIWGTTATCELADWVLASGTDVDDTYEREVKAYLLGSQDELPQLRQQGRMLLERSDVGGGGSGDDEDENEDEGNNDEGN